VSLTIAIDPGLNGGVAWNDLEGVHAVAMPPTEGEVKDALQTIVTSGVNPVCYLEKVNGFMGNAAPGSAMFNFGMGYGFIKGCLMAWHVPVIEVPPQRWIKVMGLGVRGELSKTEWKTKLQEEAQRRYPHLKVTKKTADALLILTASDKCV